MFKIVFENQRFIAVDKPAGVLSVPSRLGDHDPRPCLSSELRRRGHSIYPVHRLDEEVSGIVLFAKDPVSHKTANQWFEGRSIHKIYEAWSEPVAGLEPGKTLEWESKLLRGKKRAYESTRGKSAFTQATVAERFRWRGGEAQLWRLEPLTGRAHQLRYEMARHGHPILGDVLYGSTVPFHEGAIALRAVRVDLTGCKGAAELGLPGKLEVSGISDGVDDAR